MEWFSVGHGLQYRKHEKRKHGVRFDRYFRGRYTVSGKTITVGFGWESEGWTQDKCLKELVTLKEAAKTGQGPVTLKEKQSEAEQKRKAEQKQNLTFGQFIVGTYLPQSKQDKKPGSYAMEETLYRIHMNSLINLPLSKIAPIHIERIKKNMTDKGLSPRTIQYALQVIRHAFSVANKMGVYTGPSPTKAVKWPKLDNLKMRYLSVDEAETLLAALKNKGKNLHDAALLSLHCGLRFGEIAALTWSCVNWDAGSLAILNAKTGSRTAYLTDRARTMLEGRERGNPDDLIFPKRSGRTGGMERASRLFMATVNALGFNAGVSDRKQKVTFHTLRHTYATHLYEASHDLYFDAEEPWTCYQHHDGQICENE
jgi:integrase